VSVGESSWASVGDEAAVVNHIPGNVPRQNLVTKGEGGHLKLDARLITLNLWLGTWKYSSYNNGVVSN